MDIFSQLLSWSSVRGVLDVRCHFGSPWEIVHTDASPGEVPFHILVSGEAELQQGSGPAVPLGSGDIVLFPQGAAHRIHDTAEGKKPVSAIFRQGSFLQIAENQGKGARADVLCGRFLMASQSSQLLMHGLSERIVIKGAELSGALPGLIELMREEAAQQGPGSQALLDLLSAALFTMICRVLAGSGMQAGLLIAAQNIRLQPALQAMMGSPQEPWTLDSLAALCHLSRATFVRQFTQLAGESPGKILSSLRMALAARLLKQQQKPVSIIGEAVGYQSTAAFIRVFRDAYGMTPAQWRKQ